MPDFDMKEMTQAMDALMSEIYKNVEPGAAVIVAKDGKPVFRKGYGMANLELGVKNEPHMVFRLGSITKQFTAVAILMLYEQGKLNLEDEITKFLPDYPTHGHTITINHLLYHTSGIKSYTGMEEWKSIERKDFTVEEMIDFFKNQPMEFAPGEKWNYNNSGYFLLGAIIEKISGMTYPAFLQVNIFDPLGMNNSYFDMPNPIIPRRVSGYKPTADGYENADYLSMTQPYAAGSLASNVDDMLTWDEALYTERLLKQETLQQAWTSGKLNNGESCGYGYGWAIADFQDSHIITHAGGINGFITDGIRLPDEHIYVSILTNAGKPFPDLLAYKLAMLAVGKPYKDPDSIELTSDVLKKYSAMYHVETMHFDISIEYVDGKLIAQIPMAPNAELKALSETQFYISDSAYRLTFHLDDTGEVTSVYLTGIYGNKMEGIKTDKPLPSQRETVELPPEKLEAYTGEYQIGPGAVITVVLEEDKLIAIAPGQPAFQLHAESETVFFLKELPISLTFEKDSAGVITGLEIDQGGQKISAQKT